jgi:two-component system response regulator PilR (NtrC family)
MKDFRRTIILDDELPIVNLLTRVCEQEGHLVRPFMRPTEALECLAREPFDLLITDMYMPEADGITVTEAAWRLRPDLYVLIITGHSGMFPVERLLDGGHADIMFKPFRLNEFRARLDLARRRRAMVSRLTAETRALHEISHRHIQELQRELEGRG